MQAPPDHPESLAGSLEQMYPELARVRDLADDPVYLVGGAVRDLLLGQERADIDLVVEGDAAALAGRLGADVVTHERFGTAKVKLDGHEVDIASARAESYPRPGALPVVAVGADLAADLRRRDFTINAMAIPLRGEPRLIDPHAGQADLAAGQLCVLHDESFGDDPTRAIRAARYASRFGFTLERRTAELLRQADLESVSADRREAEILRLAAEDEAARGFSLLAEWGLVQLRPEGAELVAEAAKLLEDEAWRALAPRDRVLVGAALGPPRGEQALADAQPERPSEAVALAGPSDGTELVLARALGAEWLDRYLSEWSHVTLEIDGSDLIRAGLSQSPALGRGLEEALRRKLDGDIAGRDEELEVALEVARSDDAVA